jgi:DNA polymerase-3 subunit epsilon
MKSEAWILLDTETTGLSAPVFVIELAAQRMRGWEPNGDPFRKLLNQNAEIPAEASPVRGYTHEILERDGEPPRRVYDEFAKYASNLPLVSFDLEHDLDEVLKTDWRRLSVAPIGSRGFCALRLAQRLLDPVPAGNCKLQTLRQYYHLPDRGTHTALGNVQTVADLFEQVLCPVAEHRGLDSWDKVAAFAGEEWYQSRIPFGKYKGRLFQEARKDTELRGWLDWLASSTNPRSAKMGRWYLRQLETTQQRQPDLPLFSVRHPSFISEPVRKVATNESLILFVDLELSELRELVAADRARLAELEADYTKEKARVDAMQAILFRWLKEQYLRRDRLRLLVDHRKKYLDSLLRGGDEEARETDANYERAKAQTEKDYQEAAEAVSEKRELTAEEELEITQLWKKLVKLYHPDRFAHEPDKLETYHKLTSAINRAKDAGDLKTLREIAEDPHGFIMRQGWASLDFSDEVELAQLRRLHETLQLQIIAILESLSQLRESPDYELCRISEQKPGVLDDLAAKREKLLQKESTELEAEANSLAEQIAELSDGKASSIS